MEILHLCLCGPVTDNWNYQDNLLPKYHKKIGNSVTVITSQWVRNNSGELIKFKKSNYLNDDGVRMIRLPIKGDKDLIKKFKSFKGLYESIEKCKPNIIFIHGCQFIDMKYVVKYVEKHPEVQVYLDNHADFYNSGKNWVSKSILHKLIWRNSAKKIQPFVRRFYGVLPARVDFLTDIYKVPKEKVELLVLGADDEKVNEVKNSDANELRNKYEIKPNDFLIMTGGKINNHKTQVFLLMKAIKELKNPNIKLIVFGSVEAQYKSEFNKLLNENVKYIGWIDSQDTYRYFNASDLVVFPGLHSVLWEQVVGLGKPCVFRYMEGFTHIDLGGNCEFLYEDSVDEIKRVISEIYNSPEKFVEMKNVALTSGMEKFSYENIAKRSISFNK
ncbi:glycosyltransferase family 4 protein [[Bacillus] enclensis]|uniref:glycosyltransferase family 4 protein n=1 Tax=[Bacillus] enclensis TaxID=1402860 RepID=UPI0018DB7A3E|nr:glycosyltransferase family 4 protein [[Bacillus] enclensis]MBH9967912.1 glycosyltransferase family 4 protein [[Bacillus] enclensis]